MNFRPKKWKVIWSLLLPILFWILLAVYKFPSVQSAVLRNFFNMHNLSDLFSSGNIVIFVIEVVAIYLILSLFQRKNSALPSVSTLK